MWRGRQRPTLSRETEAVGCGDTGGRCRGNAEGASPVLRAAPFKTPAHSESFRAAASEADPACKVRSSALYRGATPATKRGPPAGPVQGAPDGGFRWVPPGPSRSPRVSLRAAARPLSRGGVQVARGAPQISKTTWRTLARRPRAAAAGDEGAAAARLLAAARLRADLRDAAVNGAARGRGDALRGAPLRHLRAPATPAASASGEGTTGCRGRQ